MLDAARSAIDVFNEILAWIPGTAIGVALIALAVALALALHRTVVRLGRRIVQARSPFVMSLFAAAGTIMRVALVIVAVSLVLPVAPLRSEVTLALTKLVLLATIGLIGWIALTALNLAADLYLLRFRLDAEDNLLARKHITQVRVLRRAVAVLVILLAAGFALMTFEPVRQYGVSLFASAGVAGLVVGLAARPLLTSLIAGVQIAVTQPIRIDDAVVVEGEWGRIEEITPTYVVVKLWDWRRLIVPLAYFMEKPFQNWTRESASLIGTVLLYVDYTVPVARVREKLNQIAHASPLWDRKVVNLQVTDAKENAIELRALVSARNGPAAFDLRCEVREQLIAFLREEYPGALPRRRAELHDVRTRNGASDIRSPELAPPG
jgi:small-conductance mechanosensitive channel